MDRRWRYGVCNRDGGAIFTIISRRALRFLAAEILLGALVSLLSLTIAVVAMGITPDLLGQRWTYGGADQVLHYGIFASALDTFPFLLNHHLGFPEAQNLFFAPLFDIWSAMYVWVVGSVVPNSVWALNLYVLGSFLTVGFTSYAFFRALKLRRTTAVVFGVIFATVPYHFYQASLGHPFLANYWALPLAGILALMVAGDQTNPFAGWVARASTRRATLLRRILPIVVLTAAVAFTQSYYFVFGAIVVGAVWFVSTLSALLAGRSRRGLVWPAVTMGSLVLLIGGQLALLSLSLGDRFQKYFAGRTFVSSENYGGKFIELLLPSLQSGIPKLAGPQRLYQSLTELAPTSEDSATAAVASLAIILCLVLVLLRVFAPVGSPRDARIGVLLVAFVAALLFFITAGLGTVLGFFASAEIRAWSRMSIVVSMVALAVLAVLIDRIAARTWIRVGVLVVVFAVAMIDQVPRISATLPLTPVSDQALKDFTAGVEDRLAPDCGVVILPLKGFPETGPIGRMGDYDEMMPYVYAEHDDLRWSYGAVEGTHSADYWKTATDPAAFASLAEAAGTCAIVIDTYAYSQSPDTWRPLVAAVGDDPSSPALISDDITHRYLFFALPSH